MFPKFLNEFKFISSISMFCPNVLFSALLYCEMLSFIQCGFFQRKELEELRRLIEQNAENEAMAHMLGAQDMDNNDVDLELQFTLQLNPGTTLNGDFYLDDSHHLNGHGRFHRNGFVPSVGHTRQNGHINNGRT